MRVALALLSILTYAATARAADAPTYGPELEGFAYPWPLANFRFES